MNFRKASIFQRDTEKPEEQNDSGGMLAVWGSPGSGKTITAVKIAKMLSTRKKNVILLLCDMAAPMLPCICPADALESNGSLAGVLAAARISENLIKHNLVTFKRNSCLAVLGLLERQNEYSTPPFTQKQVVELRLAVALELLVGGEVHLAAVDGLDALAGLLLYLVAHLAQLRHARHHAVVGDSHGRHAEVGCALDHVVDVRMAVEQGIFAMHMKMNERFFQKRSLLDQTDFAQAFCLINLIFVNTRVIF